MAMKSDVKAVQFTAQNSGVAVYAGRTRLRGILISNTTTTTVFGSVKLSDGEGTTQGVFDVPPGDVFAFNLPEDGILFKDGIFVTTLTSAKGTVLIDK